MSMRATQDLSSELAAVMSKQVPRKTWSGPDQMAAASQRIQAMFGAAAPQPIDPERLARAVAKLARGERLTDAELRWCCAGATTPVPIGGQLQRIVDDTLLTRRLLARADEQRARHQHWRRCAFALAHAVLLPSERPVDPGASNTDRLEAYVADYAEEALTDGSPSLRSQLVMDLRDTFPVSSTRPFWPYVFDGDTSVLGGVRRLQTPATSWLWRRILTDAIRESAGWSDADFVAGIDATLRALAQHEAVLDQGVGLLLDRLANTPDRPEQAALRNAAISRWGSPLIPGREPFWNRWASPEARRMVVGWLTRHVIRTFFERLGGAGADARRTRFWARYADLVDELWIFVGRRSQFLQASEVADLRAMLGPRLRHFDDENTNAFVLVLKGFAFVEFDTVGNALYVYDRGRLPIALDRGVPTTWRLKDRELAVDRIPHQGNWEARARDSLGSLTGHWLRGVRG